MTGSTPLGDTDEFAFECLFLERDDSGETRETLQQELPDPFSFIEFVDSGDQWIVHRSPIEPGYVIEAELSFVEDTDPHDVTETIAKALSGTGLSVVRQNGTVQFYIVSEVNDD